MRLPESMQAEAGCCIGRDYPAPVVEHAAAYRQARARMGAIRRTEHPRAEAQRVYARHGSRERLLRGPARGGAKAAAYPASAFRR